MAYAHVQTVYGGTLPITIAGTTVTDTLLVAIYWTDSANTNPTLTGYTPLGAGKVTNSLNMSSRLFLRENISAGITSVAIASWDNGTPGDIQGFVSEYSGLATSSSLIGVAGAAMVSPGAGTDACSSGNVNVTSQPALFYGVALDIVLGEAFTTGTGFTSRQTGNAGRVEDKRVTSTGNVAATFTGNDPDGVVWGVALAEAGGGGGGPELILPLTVARPNTLLRM